jgi:hypothetical protein
MRRIAEIGHLKTHARQKLEGAPVAQFGIELAFNDVKYVAAVAPVIEQESGRILDHPNPQIANFEGAPQRFAGFAGIRRRCQLLQFVTVKGKAGIFMVANPVLWGRTFLNGAGDRPGLWHTFGVHPRHNTSAILT